MYLTLLASTSTLNLLFATTALDQAKGKFSYLASKNVAAAFNEQQ